MTADVGLPDVWQAAAVSALGRRFATERAVEGLDRALRSRHFETARACIEVLGTGDQAAVEPLVTALAVETGVIAASAASALGALQAPAAEQPLIRALWREAPGLRVAAAEALGRSGSTAAVLPLKQAADRYPDTAFRRAVRQAIAEIQARLPGASPGQLSLAAAESGQLSLADESSGQLSLVTGQAGHLSLAEARRPPEPRDDG
jgi:HEAT repeat protein